jgi:phage baseplate assembly protein W
MPTSTALPTSTIIYSDIDDSMNVNPITGDVLKKTGAASIIQSVMNLIETNHYERPFHPEIGSGVTSLLFEQATPATCQLISKEIQNTLQNFEPRVQVMNVLVEVATDGTSAGFNVTIQFLIVSIPVPITINIFLERRR